MSSSAADPAGGPGAGAAPPGLDAVLAPGGWVLASAPSQGAGDPGRFHALFGRDGLITALQVLPSRPDVARATLRALAARIGTRTVPGTQEEPGKVPHELRDRAPAVLVERGWPDPDAPFASYATADATPWFLVLIDALGDAAVTRELEPAWRSAAGWLAGALDTGDGLVRHGTGGHPAGLSQHGWRDAIDPTDPRDGGGGIVRADGSRPPEGLADADTQGVAAAALAALARLTGEGAWTERLGALQERVGAAFDPDTMAVEPDGTRVPGAGSQLGWLLWGAALPDGEKREAAAERLCRDDVLTDAGLRTLSSDHAAFAPDAYHRGSVWPFDSWIGWGGLRAAGRPQEAERVRRGVLAALGKLGHAPELYAVERDGRVRPVASANWVQAWTIGARLAWAADADGRRVG